MVGAHMHAHAWHMWHAQTKAHLAWAASAGGGEARDSGRGRGNAPTVAGRRAAAAGGDGRERMATCQGRSGRLERARLPIGTHMSTPRHSISSLCACGNAVRVCTWARDGEDARPVQRGGSHSELVSVSKWSVACICTPHMHTHCISAPHSRRLHGPRRGRWRPQRPWQCAHDRRSSTCGRWRRRRRRASDL